MKVFVITSNFWNGVHDSVTVTGVAFFDEEVAKKYVREKNEQNGYEWYLPVFDYTVVTVE